MIDAETSSIVSMGTKDEEFAGSSYATSANINNANTKHDIIATQQNNNTNTPESRKNNTTQATEPSLPPTTRKQNNKKAKAVAKDNVLAATKNNPEEGEILPAVRGGTGLIMKILHRPKKRKREKTTTALKTHSVNARHKLDDDYAFHEDKKYLNIQSIQKRNGNSMNPSLATVGNDTELVKMLKSFNDSMYQKHTSAKAPTCMRKVSNENFIQHGKELINTKLREHFNFTVVFEERMKFKPDASSSAIAVMMNAIIDNIVHYSTDEQFNLVRNRLETELGSQSHLLGRFVTNLWKLMPSCMLKANVEVYTDNDALGYLLGKLLHILSLSSHSEPISILFDDVQWANASSLGLIGTLVSSAHKNKSRVLFAFGYQGNDRECGAFNIWLNELKTK